MTSFLDALTVHVTNQARRFLITPLRWVLLSNGSTDLNDNLIFLGFEHGCSNPSLVAKMPRLPQNDWIVRTEYDRLTDLWHLMGPNAARYLPEPIVLAVVRQQTVLAVSYLQGEGLLSSAKRGLWRSPARVLALAIDAAYCLRELHAGSAVRLEPGERLQSNLAQKIGVFREYYDLDESEEQALVELEQYCSSQSMAAKTIIHGDFWHGNLIRGTEWHQLMVVDWEHSRWSTDVSLDVFMFLLAGALWTSAVGSAEERAQIAARSLRQWRVRIIPSYLEAYGNPNGYSLLPARYGMLLCCVEKATRTIINFGYNQSSEADWRCLFAELVNLSHSSVFFDGI